jgi:two-component system NarL family response regulator
MNDAGNVPLSTLLNQTRPWSTLNMASQSVTVDLVHESTMIRRGLVAMMDQLSDISVSRDLQDVADYHALAGPSRARVAFVSPRAAATLAKYSPQARNQRAESPVGLIVIAANFGDLDAREAFQRGVRGLLLLNAEPAELLEAARRVASGGRYVMPSIAAEVAIHACKEPLTARERQILELVAEGECNQLIAENLGIAISTVKAHVQAVMSKLDVRTRTQAALVARHRGIASTWSV